MADSSCPGTHLTPDRSLAAPTSLAQARRRGAGPPRVWAAQRAQVWRGGRAPRPSCAACGARRPRVWPWTPTWRVSVCVWHARVFDTQHARRPLSRVSCLRVRRRGHAARVLAGAQPQPLWRQHHAGREHQHRGRASGVCLCDRHAHVSCCHVRTECFPHARIALRPPSASPTEPATHARPPVTPSAPPTSRARCLGNS
jgi:hypothetical protein